MKPSSMKYNPAFLGDEALIESFVARRAELERILEVIRENTADANQHLLIIGPRGIGKTTLVLRSAAEIRTEPELSSQWYPIVFGEETYLANTPAEFWLEALFHLGEQTGDARWQRAYEELRLERDENRLRGRALAQLMDFADEQGLRLVLVVENLNMLFREQLGGDGAWVLRQTLMNEPRLMLLGTATSRFQEMDEYNEALYELFRTFELEPLDEAEAEALWTSITGQGTTSTQIRPLQILTGGNPRLIRILSEFAANTSFRSLMDDLTRLVDEHTEYFKHHLDNLPPQERKVFVALADLWDPSTARTVAEAARLDVNVTSALLKRLVERGAVTTPYKRGRAQYYQVAERMYNIYHLMRRRGPAASRVHAVVRFMVSLYRDEDLVRTTQLLVEEAVGLGREQRREHFLAYEAILSHTQEPQMIRRLVEATRFALEAMPDAPESVLRLVGINALPSALLKLRVEDVDDPKTLLQLADALSQQPDRVEEAESAFQKALSKDPQNAAAWTHFGFFLSARKQSPEQAVEALNHGLTLNPENAHAWSNYGAALHQLGRAEEALDAYDRALALEPDTVFAWCNRGAILDDLRRTEEALESLDRALALSPENVAAWLNRATILARLGRHEEALQACDRVLALLAGSKFSWSEHGFVLGYFDFNEERPDSWDRAFDTDPVEAYVLSERGIILRRLGRNVEALDSFDRALVLNANSSPQWGNRGAVLGLLGRMDEALDAFDHALRLDAENVAALYNKGLVLQRMGRKQEGVECYDQALTLEPENVALLLRRGFLNRELSRFEKAKDDFRNAFDFAGDDAKTAATMLLMVLLEDLHRPDEALETARACVQRFNDSADALNSIAWVFFKGGRKEDATEAEAWARRAVDLDPGNGFLRHTLACLIGAQDRWKEAFEHAVIFLTDHEMLRAGLSEVIDFFIEAVAAGHKNEVLRVIQASGAVEALEPLIVAVRRIDGAEVNVAREILEVSNDVMARIEARRMEVAKR